jgi:hypothetical protein
VNTGSLSETSELGIPCRRKILSTKRSATLLAVYGWQRGIKWANLESLSTTTMIQLKELWFSLLANVAVMNKLANHLFHGRPVKQRRQVAISDRKPGVSPLWTIVEG